MYGGRQELMRYLFSRVKELIFAQVPPPLFMRLVAWQYYAFAERELRVLREIVVPGKDAIDIGANYGVYCHYLSRLAPRVYAYEPNPGLAARLRKAVRDNVEVIEAGLSDREGDCLLDVPVMHGREIHGHGTLEPTVFSGESRRIPVRIGRLDSVKYENIGFMKIDVEGHEVAVLQGGADLVKRCRPRLLMEIEQRHLNGRSVDDVLEFVASFGYLASVLTDVRRGRGTYRRIERSSALLDSIEYAPYTNFIFVPQEDCFRDRLIC
jgi:FkbM family methyltransferase